MEVVWGVLIGLGILVAIGLLVGGAIMLIAHLRSGASISISMRSLLRLYLYVGIIAGVLVFTPGASDLIKAAAAGLAGNEFSYSPVWVELPREKPETSHPLELADRGDLSDAELEELSRILNERRELQDELQEERDLLGLDRALEEGLIRGISFAIIGALVWVAHMLGRHVIERPEERGGLLNRAHLILLTSIFGIITVVSLPQAVFETISYAVLDPVGRDSQPGAMLALSITSLPIWLLYLWCAIRAVRRGS